ncbi:MAG TPA: insulinase family protein [Saprospiraceae bacterium]|nr:insulinase family protein [Saprospiraceae bacterium]
MNAVNFQQFKNDPINVQIFTLSNGLQLFMSVNKDAPRIFTNIAVRAGSKHDPTETTGLAHYLEHMMFKGTSKIGALNWEKEKKELDKIANLYEQYRQESDPDKRKSIYQEIDQVSNHAATYAAANEYDKFVSVLGAEKTNAYTWLEQTVYVNDIPSNELERWLQLESERFKMVVLRLFHTELETVYEEFNINQDKDFRKVYKVLNEVLFPHHTYSQTTIGKGEHLKNPSHFKIYEFFSKYYRPNNMAIMMAGDFDPKEAVILAEKYFGELEPIDVPKYEFDEQPEIKEVVRRQVYGQEAAYLQLGWRFEGANSDKMAYFHLLKGLLFNTKAGLIDLNLINRQLLLEAYAYFSEHEDYSTFLMYGKPREGQSLEEIERLLLTQVELIKKGEFEDWMLEAVIKDYKYREMKSLESNKARVDALTHAFTVGIDWSKAVNLYQEMEAISKDDLIQFVRKHFKTNYVAIQKLTGEDANIIKVDKPAITPLEVNRDAESDFFKAFKQQDSKPLEPVFVDFEKEIHTTTLSNGLRLDMVKNPHNSTFSLRYIFEMGKNSSKLLKLAIQYLTYLGTDKYSAEALQLAFFKLGLTFGVYANNKKIYVKLDGLEESFEEGVELFEHLLTHVVPDEEKLAAFIQDILTSREDAKKSKEYILKNGLVNYAYYGPDSPFTDRLDAETLKQIKAEELTSLIKSLLGYEHHIYFYGTLPESKLVEILDKHHQVSLPLKPLLPAKIYPEVPTDKDQVYFVHFPMVQTEVLMMSKGTNHFDLEEYLMGSLWNEYFGIGMSSVVFQEIRESKGFAYSTYAYYRTPVKKDEAHYIQAFVGTQPDKLKDAVTALRDIIENMPVHRKAIKAATHSLIKKVETERIQPDNIYWKSEANKKLGVWRDLRKDKYEFLKKVTPDDLVKFQQEKIKHRKFAYLILGDKEQVDMDFLNSIGEVKMLDLETLFGY